MKHTLLAILLWSISLTSSAQEYRFLVGTYTNTGKSQGVYCFAMNGKTLGIRHVSVTSGVSNPSYLCVTPDKRFVYSVNESNEGSAANAFSFNAQTGSLELLNRSMTKSKGPCFISCTKKHVFTANYGGGSLSVFARNADGSLSDCIQNIQHHGSSINVVRQAEPHVHQVLVNNGFVIANDLGTDQVVVYKYDPSGQKQVLMPWDTLTVRKGSGPRHLTFSRNGKMGYLLQELDGTVSVLTFRKGRLRLVEETTVVNEKGQKAWAADIHLSPDGRFLYATNRAPANTITCFRVLKDGRLHVQYCTSTLGDGPRNFAISPDGEFLLVAHQFTNNLVLFERNVKTGALLDTGKRIDVGAPVCVVFY